MEPLVEPVSPPSRLVNGESNDDAPLMPLLPPAPLSVPVSELTRVVSGATGLDVDGAARLVNDPPCEPPPSAPVNPPSKVVSGATGLLLPLLPCEPPETGASFRPPSNAVTGASGLPAP